MGMSSLESRLSPSVEPRLESSLSPAQELEGKVLLHLSWSPIVTNSSPRQANGTPWSPSLRPGTYWSPSPQDTGRYRHRQSKLGTDTHSINHLG